MELPWYKHMIILRFQLQEGCSSACILTKECSEVQKRWEPTWHMLFYLGFQLPSFTTDKDSETQMIYAFFAVK